MVFKISQSMNIIHFIDHKKTSCSFNQNVLMAVAVGHGFKSHLQPETFHVGNNSLSSSTSTFLSFYGDPTGCDNN
jgi:hypothetical protein